MNRFFKFLTRIMSMILITLCVLSSACNIPDPPTEGGDTESVDATRTQLYVHAFTGGYGTEFLYELKRRFEDAYSETCFNPNDSTKKGVQIMIGGDTNSVQNSVDKSSSDVFFVEGNYMPELVSKDVLLDITDWVTAPLTEYNETESIEDKMDERQKDYLKVAGKYYAVPHYFSTSGIIFDIDLFNNNNFYLAKNGCPSEAFVDGGSFDGEYCFTNSDSELSAGADGVYGTEDDGLPATYEEFYALCSQMMYSSTVPFIWPGKYMDMHLNYLLVNLKAESDGYDEMALNYTFNGISNTLIDVSNTGVVTKKPATKIDRASGYKLYEQAGLYNAIKFAETIVKEGYYESDMGYCFDTTDHLQAQEHFIRSNYDPYYQKPIAMLLDGIWWEREATAAFDRMVVDYPGTSKTQRNFGFMPMPKPTQDQVGSDHLVLEGGHSFVFVNKKVASDSVKLNVAKAFVRFACTDVSLREFTKITGAPKALDYMLDDNTYNSMSNFSKNLWNYLKQENTKVLYAYSSDSMYITNEAKFEAGAKFNTNPYGSIAISVRDNVSAETIFNNLRKFYSQEYWNLQYQSFFSKD